MTRLTGKEKDTMHYTARGLSYADRIVVTSQNPDEAQQLCAALDQRKKLKPGCETWAIFYEPGQQRGQMTVWPADGRGAICLGGDSLWGDWCPDHLMLVTEDNPAIGYWIDGTEYTEDDPELLRCLGEEK